MFPSFPFAPFADIARHFFMKTIHLTYCGMAGSGPTVAAAKQDAARKIEAVLEACFIPRMVVGARNGDAPARIALAWRTPRGIESGYPDPLTGRLGGLCIHHAAATMDQVVRDLRYNIAQGEAQFVNGEWLGGIPAVIADYPDLVRNFLEWVGWQLAYHYARKTFPFKRSV